MGGNGRRLRTAAAIVGVAAVTGALIWLVWKAPHRADLATYGGFAVAVIVPAASLITYLAKTRQPDATRQDQPAGTLADALAKAVLDQWTRGRAGTAANPAGTYPGDVAALEQIARRAGRGRGQVAALRAAARAAVDGAGLATGLAYGLVFGLVWGLTAPQTWTSCLAFAQLAVRWHTPGRLLRFLDDARQRDVLRTVGPVYQFRRPPARSPERAGSGGETLGDRPAILDR